MKKFTGIEITVFHCIFCREGIKAGKDVKLPVYYCERILKEFIIFLNPLDHFGELGIYREKDSSGF